MPVGDRLGVRSDTGPGMPVGNRLRAPVAGRLALLAMGLLGLAALGQFGDFAGSRALITYPAGTLVCMALLIAVLGAPPRPRSVFVVCGTYLGGISYGLYVFHLLFIDTFGVAAAHDPLARLVRIGAALVVIEGQIYPHRHGTPIFAITSPVVGRRAYSVGKSASGPPSDRHVIQHVE